LLAVDIGFQIGFLLRRVDAHVPFLAWIVHHLDRLGDQGRDILRVAVRYRRTRMPGAG